MLRSSGTTLLMPRNTPHMATGLVALSSSIAALAWLCRFLSSGVTCLNSLGFWANMKGHEAKQGLGWLACVPKNSPLQKGKALHILCMVSALQSAACCALL